MTGDEPQGTVGRVQTAGEAHCLLPAFLCVHSERETSGYEAVSAPFLSRFLSGELVCVSAILKFLVRLGAQCCVELHIGTVLGSSCFVHWLLRNCAVIGFKIPLRNSSIVSAVVIE